MQALPFFAQPSRGLETPGDVDADASQVAAKRREIDLLVGHSYDRPIEGMKPGADTPAHALGWRLYHLLSDRYQHGLTQDVTAQRLNITTRHLQREQKRAIHLLAERLWQESQQIRRPSERGDDAPTVADNWQSQVQQELSVPQQHQGEHQANLAETVEGAVRPQTALPRSDLIAEILQVAQGTFTVVREHHEIVF